MSATVSRGSLGARALVAEPGRLDNSFLVAPTIVVNGGQTKGRLPTLLGYAPAWERECCFPNTEVKKKQTHERLGISELLETLLPK